MAKVSIFQNVLQKELQNIVASSKEVELLTRIEAQKIFNAAEQDFFLAFETHDVTQELEGGNTAPNLSKTLVDYSNYKDVAPNLFSFIGFEEGSDPIGKLRSLLEKNINFSGKLRKRRINGGVEFNYSVEIPTVADLEDDTPFPNWDGGRSWLRGIERGISGLSAYLSGNYSNSSDAVSRSKTGTIAKNPDGSVRVIRPNARFRNTKYLSELLNNFKNNIK